MSREARYTGAVADRISAEGLLLIRAAYKNAIDLPCSESNPSG